MNLSTIAALCAVTRSTPTQFRAGQLAHEVTGTQAFEAAIRSALLSEKAVFAPNSKFLRRGPDPKTPSLLAASTTSCIAPARDLRPPRGRHASLDVRFTTPADPGASLATSRGHHGECRVVWVGDFELLYFVNVFRVGIGELFPRTSKSAPVMTMIAKFLRNAGDCAGEHHAV